LDDAVTATHYKVGQPDAKGKPIRLGDPMTYIDWKSEQRSYYLYRVEPVTWSQFDPNTGEKKEFSENRWVEKGMYDTKEAAKEALEALKKEAT
jgi:hypothetical protein